MWAILVPLALALIAGEVHVARWRARPVFSPSWQDPSLAERCPQFQDPDTGYWVVVDRETCVVLARGLERAKTLRVAGQNLGRRAAGEPGPEPGPDDLVR